MNIKKFSLSQTEQISFFYKRYFIHNFFSFNPISFDEKEKFNNKYSFKYPDFFSSNINVWKKFLTNIDSFSYLEIGTFEGRSALFVSEFNNCKKIVCVDPYLDYNESERYDFKMIDVYESVNQKLKKIKDKNVELIKDTSDSFFKESRIFKVIYLDGHHNYEYVKRDFINAMSCLEKNGILICDDFLWFKYEKLKENPAGAILSVTKITKKI